MNHAETRRAALSLAECPGWTQLVLPHIQGRIAAFQDATLHDASLSSTQREEVRQQYLALKSLLDSLRTRALDTLASLTAEDQLHVPIHVHETLSGLFAVLPGTPDVPQPSRAVSPPVVFPAPHSFNPFDASTLPPPATEASAVTPKRRKKVSSTKPPATEAPADSAVDPVPAPTSTP